MENLIKEFTLKNVNGTMIDIEEFITLYNDGKAELLDVRVPVETKVWQMNFGLKIPVNELPDRLDELPKDKIIVCSCPKTDRSIVARTYLASLGIEAKYLRGGLLGMVDRLKGGKAKDLEL